MKEETKKGVIAGFVLLFAIVFLNYNFYVRDINAQNSRLRSEIADIERKKQAALALLKQMKSLKAKRDSLKEEIEKLKRLLPKTEDLPGLIRSIAHLAQISGIDLSSVELGKEIVYAQKHYAAVNIKVSFGADYYQLRSFLEKVDTLNRLVKPHRLSISSKGISENPQLKVSGILRTYRYVEGQPKKKQKNKRKRR